MSAAKLAIRPGGGMLATARAGERTELYGYSLQPDELTRGRDAGKRSFSVGTFSSLIVSSHCRLSSKRGVPRRGWDRLCRRRGCDRLYRRRGSDKLYPRRGWDRLSRYIIPQEHVKNNWLVSFIFWKDIVVVATELGVHRVAAGVSTTENRRMIHDDPFFGRTFRRDGLTTDLMCLCYGKGLRHLLPKLNSIALPGAQQYRHSRRVGDMETSEELLHGLSCHE